MSKVFAVVFLIFGTIVGSGFSSGKEIMVFFSRFGSLSYLYIFLACVLFFVLFYFFLTCGQKVVDKIENNKLTNGIVIFISLVFCASMFAGIESLFSYFPKTLYAVLVAVLLVVCVLVCLRGIRGLEKVNVVLMPTTFVVFLAVLIFCMKNSGGFEYSMQNSWAGILYGPLYVVLNTSMSGLVISKCGKDMTKKQAIFSSLFSSLLVFVLLVLGNFVLQKRADSFFCDMPFLYLVGENPVMFILDFLVILVGCFTTLISLTFTLKSSFMQFFKSDFFASVFAVLLPFLISGLGFSQIVAHLYPLCSVIGVFILLFFVSSFKQTDKEIHQKRKHAKDGRGSHH